MPRLALPPSLAWIALLAAAFALPGLGHAPWETLAAIVLAALWLARAAARDWTAGEERAGAAAAAPLILLGSVGLVVRAHEAVPELAALAALAGALAALPHAAARP